MNKSFGKDAMFYLSFCLFNAILYTFVKLFATKTGMKTLQIAAYMNIGVFVIYNILFVKKIWQDKLYINVFKFGNLLLSTSMISAVTKIYCIQYIEPRDAVIIAHATPFMVMLGAKVFLKEKMVLKYWLYGALSLLGVIIYVWKKIEIYNFYYLILLLHVVFKATMHITTRRISKTSVFQVMFYDNLFYSLFAVYYIEGHGGFDFKIFLNWQILAIIIITTISLFSLVKAYSIASSGITKLQNLDFSKIIFSFILAVIFLDDKIEGNELLGSGIIVISIILSQVELKTIFKKKLSSI